MNTLFGADATDFLTQVRDEQAKSAAAVDVLWTQIVGGNGMWQTVAGFSLGIACITLSFYFLYLLKAWTSDEDDAPLGEFAITLIICFCLANNAAVAKNITIGLRDIINTAINRANTQLVDQTRLNQNLQMVVANQEATTVLQQTLQTCQQQATAATMQACLEQVRVKWAQYVASGAIRPKTPLDMLGGNLDAAISTLRNNTNVAGALWDLKNKISVDIAAWAGGLAISPFMMGFKMIISGLAYLYQWLIEISMMFTAFLFPPALALGLLPGRKSIMGWLSAFLSLGNAKFAYLVICGVGAQAMLVNPSQDYVFLLLAGIGAPFFSALLSAGGGLAMYAGLAGAIAFAAKSGVQLAGAIGPGGAAKAGKFLAGKFGGR